MANDAGLLAWLKDKLDRGSEKLSAAVDSTGNIIKEKFGDLGGLLNTVLNFFRVQADVFFQGIVSYFAEDIKSFRTFISFKWADAIKAEQEKNINKFIDGIGLGEDERQAFLQIAKSTEGLPGIMSLVMWIMIHAQLVGGLGANAFGKIDQQMKERFAPIPAQAQAVLRAAFIAPERTEEIRETMRHNGLSDQDIDLMFLANYNLYPEAQVRALYFRGALTEEQANNRLAELGFTPERIEEIKQGWKVIPGIQDLIMMQAKEAFEPALIAKFGLGAEAPTDIYEHTRKLGLDDEWVDRYWSSHWIHPQYATVMQMLHRRLISKEDVYEWYKLVEIPPYWRELLDQVSYHPYTRVDVRRMHDMGVLSDDQLVDSMQDIGYDLPRAEKMAEFYKAYNARGGQALSRSDILKAYEDRDLTEGETLYLLKSIGYTNELAYFYIYRVDTEMERATRLERIEIVKEKFLSNLISAVEARNYLLGYGVDQLRITELIDRWEVKAIKNVKLPSKTDLDKFVRSKVIDQDGYRVEMAKLGYSDYYVDLYWKHIEAGGAIE